VAACAVAVAAGAAAQAASARILSDHFIGALLSVSRVPWSMVNRTRTRRAGDTMAQNGSVMHNLRFEERHHYRKNPYTVRETLMVKSGRRLRVNRSPVQDLPVRKTAVGCRLADVQMARLLNKAQ
jgi:hypothetical protein